MKRAFSMQIDSSLYLVKMTGIFDGGRRGRGGGDAPSSPPFTFQQSCHSEERATEESTSLRLVRIGIGFNLLTGVLLADFPIRFENRKVTRSERDSSLRSECPADLSFRRSGRLRNL